MVSSGPVGEYRHIRHNREVMYEGEVAMPPIPQLRGGFYAHGETAAPSLLAVTTLTGLATYLNRLPDDPIIKSVSFAVEGGSLWIVTEVEAGGSLDRLEGLFEAEAAARQSADVAVVFRILDRSIGEVLEDGPRSFTPIRK